MNEFSKQLQEQMAALMGNVDESPEMKRDRGHDEELGAAADPGAPVEQQNHLNDGLGGKAAVPTTEEPFQETIRKTMERMQASGSKLLLRHRPTIRMTCLLRCSRKCRVAAPKAQATMRALIRCSWV